MAQAVEQLHESIDSTSVSVVIPVRNEISGIRACIEGILSQSIKVHEIIVVDSGSTDGTLEILREYPVVKIIEIKPNEFNHGETRNLGVKQATGDFVVLTVGDARPSDNLWIEKLLKGFINENVAGVCGQQIVPHERDKNPVEWFRPQSMPEIKEYRYGSEEEFNALTPQEKKRACAWDDVCAMYRRSILLKMPFQRTSYCEDMIWAREALLSGYSLVYNRNARVYHYHLEDYKFTYKRTFTTVYYRYKYLGWAPIDYRKSPIKWLSTFKLLLLLPGFNMFEKYRWWMYNVHRAKARKAAYVDFLTYKNQSDADLDEYHLRICGVPPIPLKQPN